MTSASDEPMIIEPVREARLLADASRQDRIVATFSGEADLVTHDVLSRFLAKVHEEACRAHVDVTVDLTGLQFINSSCLMAFVSWLTRVQAMAEARYRVTVRVRRDKEMQRRIAKGLRQFVVVDVQEVAAA